ncbi:coiled-coil domain-containing protein 181 isoform X1 [Bufo bufo]|uniref:coiled-coil domain-containing protein 181 isoform X1 n=2 Tax=Bufo bufo TaxID=8384 RepID=UPI001ABEE4CF|nr:coiled-coil domain-containing protein 181 isoform X1 [Bufo bufo]
MTVGEQPSLSKNMSNQEESDSDGVPEYDDDFEKDLDWLINEEDEKSKSSQSQEEELSDLKLDSRHSVREENKSDTSSSSENEIVHVEPNTVSELAHDSMSECEESDIEDEEAKRYITEKIEEANKKLEMETVDENRERKLKFKENLVDLEVPPLDFPSSDRTESFTEDDVVDGMSQLQVDEASADGKEHNDKKGGTGEEPKDAKVLVEKDGKFELVNLRDIENQCSLPPINNTKDSSKLSSHSDKFVSSANGDKKYSTINNVNGFFPQPPTGPKVRPNSANLTKSLHKVKPQRRVQSASVSTRNTTFSLSPEQKELQKRILERKERLRREDEERRKEQDELKRRENEMAFKMWLQRKRSQLIEEKRVQQAKEMETSSTPDEEKDAEQAFALWLKRKHNEKIKDKKMEELQKQEYEAFLLDRKDREGAFSQWLRQKRIQKRAEQQAAMERSRTLLLEARRSKQIHNLLYNISDSKPFCYMDR